MAQASETFDATERVKGTVNLNKRTSVNKVTTRLHEAIHQSPSRLL